MGGVMVPIVRTRVSLRGGRVATAWFVELPWPWSIAGWPNLFVAMGWGPDELAARVTAVDPLPRKSGGAVFSFGWRCGWPEIGPAA
jgi:hypothetical protein